MKKINQKSTIRKNDSQFMSDKGMVFSATNLSIFSQNFMKKISSLLILALLASCSGMFKQEPKFLFIQKAKAATFDGKILQLHNTAKNTIYFANRPNQLAGHISNSDFLKSWNSTNKASLSGPNTAISYYDKNGKIDVVMVEISNPKVTNNSVSYNVKILKGKLPKISNEVTLFVDGVSCPSTLCQY